MPHKKSRGKKKPPQARDNRHQEKFKENRLRSIAPATTGQEKYIRAIQGSDITFGIGPAGTGKTFLAAVMAVHALKDGSVEKIILVRPAVEAGERLGYLPGTLQDKVDPFMRPIYDSMEEMLTPETIKHYMEIGIIEIAPLAFMRGRTLSKAFVILDEAQNTTKTQMLMFLTRLGRKSKTVITGDISQIDLLRKSDSGLVDSIKRLQDIDGISIVKLGNDDVVRHKLVQNIINAYEDEEE